jgi:CheY-like chemotaxis protein
MAEHHIGGGRMIAHLRASHRVDEELERVVPAPRRPRPDPAEPLQEDPDRSAGSGTSPRGRVLIVEDEYFVALASEDALSDAGFAVVGIATTADDAVAKADATRPDLILMDVRLAPPGSMRDGIDAAAEILARFGIRSLFATAHVDPGTRARGERAAQPLGWLSKPFSSEDLVAAVGAAMAKAHRLGSSSGSG